MQNRDRINRLALMALMATGILLIPIAPLARLANEGFGSTPPGPIAVSDHWQAVAYVLIPVGAAISIVSGAVLVWLDRRK